MEDDEFQDDVQEEKVPLVISDEYFSTSLQKAEDFIKELRSQENYELANQFLHIVTILENVFYQFKNEEQKTQYLLDQRLDATGKIEAALKISQKDNEVISKLKSEVLDAWKETDASIMREQHTSESLNVTRDRYLNLKEKLQKMSSKLEMNEELGEHKLTVLQQCERLHVEVEELNKRLFVQREYSEELQKKLDDSIEKNRDLFREWDSATNDSLANKKKAEKLQKELEEFKENYEKNLESLIHYQESSENYLKRLTERDKQVVNLTDRLDKFRGDNLWLKENKSKLELTIKSYKTEITHIKLELKQFESYVRLKDDQNRKLVITHEQEVKKVENLVRKICSIEKLLSRHEQDILIKKNEIVTAEKERDLIKKSSDDMKRENDKLSQKIEQLMKEIERLNVTKLKGQYCNIEASILTLKQEKQKLEEDQLLINNDLKVSIEREKRSSANVKKLQANIETVEAEKLYQTEIIKQLNEDAEFRKKQYEQIRTELNESNEQVAYFKHEYNVALKHLKDVRSDYQRCHEKESELKDIITKCKNQIDDLNNKMTLKLTEILSLMKKVQQMEKRNRDIRRELEKTNATLKLCRVELKNMEHDNTLLKEEIHQNHERFIKMKTQADKIVRERDLIATQMYRKNDENALLEDQVSVLKMSIERGNVMYNERLEDIKVMKNEIQSLRSQCNVLKRGLENTTDMRHEVLQLHRKLNQERTKAKVLEDEMQTPMNVHRWRKLGNRDPGRMELIRKCHRLQRNCLKESTRVVRAEGLIKVLQDQIAELEKKLSRCPKQDVSEKLLLTRTKLQENTKRMKAAIAISRATECDVYMKEKEIAETQKELNVIKCQLFKEKRTKHKLMQKLSESRKNSENLDYQKEMNEKLKTLGNALKRSLLT
ncbi:cilia- and flagella-associated protein 58-like [Chironomus tepperi]|uniref:cilia- and flagella-associated protein 58-like n=1 Tax=Chironomus tepperi TaxID=113505 RepID=UPI00391F6746